MEIVSSVNKNNFLLLHKDISIINNRKPVPVASLSEERIVFDRSNTGIAGSKPARGIYMLPRFSVLYCPV
jgi:hypothetical protein